MSHESTLLAEAQYERALARYGADHPVTASKRRNADQLAAFDEQARCTPSVRWWEL